MLVKVDKLYFPVDFIVLDMDKDREVPLILRWPFLATGKTLIDVQKQKLTLHVQDNEATFNIFEVMKYPTDNDECYQVNMVDELTVEKFEEENIKLPLEACINFSDSTTEANFERREYVNYLESTTPIFIYWKNMIEELGKKFIFIDLIHPRSSKTWAQDIASTPQVCLFRWKFNIVNNYFFIFGK